MAPATPQRAEPRPNARGATTRAKLLDAALTSFATRGFYGTTTRDIADAAGMSPAGVYAHYRTKEELLFSLSLAGHINVRDVVARAVASCDDPAAQLRALAHDFAAWHARFHTHARVVQYEMAALTPDHADEIARVRRHVQAYLRDVILAGVVAGRFRIDDAGPVTRAILSLGIDVARWYNPSGSLTPEQIGLEYAALALRIVDVV